MTIEIVSFPINSMMIFHSYVSLPAIYSEFSHQKCWFSIVFCMFTCVLLQLGHHFDQRCRWQRSFAEKTLRNGRVEIIPNDQGNRITPSYVPSPVLTATEWPVKWIPSGYVNS